MVNKKKVDEKKVSKKAPQRTSVGKTLKKNPWILSTMVLALVILVLAFSLLPSSSSQEKAANSVLELAQQQLGDSVTLKSVEEFGNNFYVVTLSYQGQESDIYITKDGGELAAGVTSISTILNPEKEVEEKPQQPAPAKNSYSQEELVEISSTVECLAQKDVKIYGADWCGYTKSFVQTLGGFDVIAPIYVECTSEAELCSQEGITGYPTTKIGGKTYSGPRTFEGLESETGCAAPKLEVQLAPAASASC